MKNLFLLFTIFFIVTLTSKAQDTKINFYDPPIPYNGNTDQWGNDYLVADSEPFGRPSGVYRNSNSTIYVAIPDTNISLPGADEGVVILMSTNNGADWLQKVGISPAAVYSTKMIISHPDSVYFFYLLNGLLKTINIVNGTTGTFTDYVNIKSFDVTASSTGSLYLIIDLYDNNQVRIFGSSNGGVNWGGQIFLSSSAADPTISMSATGDTALINYRGTPFTDTLSSNIRNVRYRETGPGTLLVAGSFTSPVPAGVPKIQFEGVRSGANAWLFYSQGVPGNIDLYCIASTDGGTTYGAPFTIGSVPGRDEIWFDAKYYTTSGGGVGLIYYSDSVQAGPPTNASDKMYYTSAELSSPTIFTTSTDFSEHPPVYSAERRYIPTLIEYYNTAGDAGAIWVGANGSGRAIYFDRLQSMTGITNYESGVLESYSLSQNYPNPFNPVTNLEFGISITGFVQLKVYDILGNEVAVLVNEKKNAGRYNYQLSADDYRLSSGTYFYSLLVNGNLINTRKMILLK